MNSPKRPVRCVELGGTSSRRCNIRGSKIEAFVKTGAFHSVDELVAFAGQDLPEEVAGIAVSTAGVIDGSHGRILRSPNIHYLNDCPLGSLMASAHQLSCIVGNDMETAVMGMRVLVPQVNGMSFLGVTWSTGIGMRAVDSHGDIVFRGTEGGHIAIDPSPYALLCGCGRRGCAEAIVGGEAIKRRIVHEAAVADKAIPQGMHPCAFLDSQEAAGERWAQRLYDVVAEGMATLLANVLNFADIHGIVWKGSFANAALKLPRVHDSIRERLSNKTIVPERSEVPFFMSPMVDGVKDADALIGAAELHRKCFRIV